MRRTNLDRDRDQEFDRADDPERMLFGQGIEARRVENARGLRGLDAQYESPVAKRCPQDVLARPVANGAAPIERGSASCALFQLELDLVQLSSEFHHQQLQ